MTQLTGANRRPPWPPSTPPPLEDPLAVKDNGNEDIYSRAGAIFRPSTSPVLTGTRPLSKVGTYQTPIVRPAKSSSLSLHYVCESWFEGGLRKMFANSLQRNFTGRPQERHILPAALPALRLFDSKSIRLALLVPLAALVGANDYSLVLPSNTVPESLVPHNDFSGPGRFLGNHYFPDGGALAPGWSPITAVPPPSSLKVDYSSAFSAFRLYVPRSKVA